MQILMKLAIAIGLTGCVAKTKQFNQHVVAGRCDEAVLNLPQHDPLVKLANRSEQAAGSVLSFAFVGASYTTEVLWDVAGGTVMAIALCSPVLLASVTSTVGTDDKSKIKCLPGRIDALGAPPLGRQALKRTQGLRCPDLASLSRSLRSVSSCYEARGGKENFHKAEQNLKAVIDSEDFYACLPKAEKETLSRQLLIVQNKKALTP
jgi:hypothetical protein